MPVNRRLFRFFVLSGLLCLAPEMAEADACRDAFVACVAKTGNVPECSSVSRSCAMGATDERLDIRDVDVKPRLFGREGDRWIQITIRNPNSNDVELTNHTEELTCADGSIFTAHFRFAGRILEGAEQIVSDPQIVCPGADFADGAMPDADSHHPSASGARYACEPGNADAPVYDLTAGKAGRIEARSGPVRVIYDLSGGTAEGLYEVLCRQTPGTSKQSKVPLKKLRKLLDDILGPTAAGNAPTSSSSIGSRN